MKMTLTTAQAASELTQDENSNWTYYGALALVGYLEEVEEDTGEEIEFDRIAIRCDYAQWDSLTEWAEDYHGSMDFGASMGVDLDGNESDEERDQLIRSYIQDQGTLIEFTGGIIVSAF